MASEINSERANQSQDLRELQDNYRKKRQTVDDEGRSELQRARTDTQNKIKNESVSGEAAVSHLRAANKDQLEQMRNDTEQRVVYERKNLNKRYQNEMDHGREELDGLSSNVKAKEDQYQAALHDETKKESELRTRESKATNSIAQEQALHRAHIMSEDQKELAEFNNKVQHEKQTLSQRANQEVSELSENNHKKIEQLNQQQSQALSKQTQIGESQINALREKETKNMEAERGQFTKTETALREHSQSELKSEQERDSKKFLEVRHENQVEGDRQRETGTKNMEKTRGYYDKNIATIEKTGDAKVTEQKTIQEHRVKTLDQQQKDDLLKMKTEHEMELKDSEEVYKNQSDQNKGFYRQSLVEQRKHFDEAFQKNLKAFSEQVRSQREMLTHTLAKEKKDVTEDVGHYNSKNSDPFYRMSDPKAELSETSSHYILQTRVPEHEKDNVKVVVHENKVIVQGARQFEDRIDEPENKIATHNYQTYRQEIPLEHPVHEKYLHREYDNGVLTIKIPKA